MVLPCYVAKVFFFLHTHSIITFKKKSENHEVLQDIGAIIQHNFPVKTLTDLFLASDVKFWLLGITDTIWTYFVPSANF